MVAAPRKTEEPERTLAAVATAAEISPILTSRSTGAVAQTLMTLSTPMVTLVVTIQTRHPK